MKLSRAISLVNVELVPTVSEALSISTVKVDVMSDGLHTACAVDINIKPSCVVHSKA
jgi:hypothetical protein